MRPGPELLVADNGPAFKSEVFTNTCLDLGVTIMRTIAGLPAMRGTVERMFGTTSLDLMPRLDGRTFSNPPGTRRLQVGRSRVPRRRRFRLDSGSLGR